MDPAIALALIAVIAELMSKYGVPAALDIIYNWKVENPTLEDVEALKTRVPHPDEYFPGGK